MFKLKKNSRNKSNIRAKIKKFAKTSKNKNSAESSKNWKFAKLKNLASLAVIALFAGMVFLPNGEMSQAEEIDAVQTVFLEEYNFQGYDLKLYIDAEKIFKFAVDPTNPDEALVWYYCQLGSTEDQYCGHRFKDQDVVLEIPSHVKIEGKIYPVATVAYPGFFYGGFFNYAKSIRVIFPETLKTIEAETFSNFYNRTKISDLKIPQTVQQIGTHAFQGQEIDEFHVSAGMKFAPASFEKVTINKLYIHEISQEELDRTNSEDYAGEATIFGGDDYAGIKNLFYLENRGYDLEFKVNDLYLDGNMINRLVNAKIINDEESGYFYHQNLLANMPAMRIHLSCDVAPPIEGITEEEMNAKVDQIYLELVEKYVGVSFDDPTFEEKFNALDDEMLDLIDAEYEKQYYEIVNLVDVVNYEEFAEANGHEIIIEECKPEVDENSQNSEKTDNSLENSENSAKNSANSKSSKNSKTSAKNFQLIAPNTGKK